MARLIARCVLPHVGRAEKDHIPATFDEAEFVQAFDLLAPQRRLKGEIEIVELLHHRQAAGSHRGLQTAVIPQLNLRGQQLLDGLGRGQRAAIDAVENGVERFQAARHPEVREHVPQAITARERDALHAAPPVSWA